MKSFVSWILCLSVILAFSSQPLFQQRAWAQETGTPNVAPASSEPPVTSAESNANSGEPPAKVIILSAHQAAIALVILAAGLNMISTEQKTRLLDRIDASVSQLSDSLIYELRKIRDEVESRQDRAAPSADSGTRARGQQCSGTPEECCGDFFKKHKVQKKDGKWTWGFYKNPAQRQKLQCCYQWDDVHGGLEIFDRHGNHLGERGCNDLDKDPCAYSPERGEHARPNSQTHRLRWGASCE